MSGLAAAVHRQTTPFRDIPAISIILVITQRLKMGAVSSSETLGKIDRSTQSHVTEDLNA